jgi:hypothetical protein
MVSITSVIGKKSDLEVLVLHVNVKLAYAEDK